MNHISCAYPRLLPTTGGRKKYKIYPATSSEFCPTKLACRTVKTEEGAPSLEPRSFFAFTLKGRERERTGYIQFRVSIPGERRMQRVLEELLFAESHVENTLRVFTPLNVETDDHKALWILANRRAHAVLVVIVNCL